MSTVGSRRSPFAHFRYADRAIQPGMVKKKGKAKTTPRIAKNFFKPLGRDGPPAEGEELAGAAAPVGEAAGAGAGGGGSVAGGEAGNTSQRPGSPLLVSIVSSC